MSIRQPPSIGDLIAGHRPGYGLDRGFYLQHDVYAADIELLLRRWTLVGHISQIPEIGDWFTAELGTESAILVRDETDAVRALANVCRHRGSRVCVETQGGGAMLTCPYHAWTYRLDGALRSAREMPEGFDPAGHGLKPLPITVIGGLIFIAFAPGEPPKLGDAEAAVAAMTGQYGWETARIAARETYRVAANWKLVMENYHECYHCGPAHPEFAVLHALARPNARVLSSEPDPRTGLADLEVWGRDADGFETARIMRSALSDGCLTGGHDGRPLAPPMGPAGALWDGNCVFGELGLLSAFLAYADHGVIYRFIPRGVMETEMEVIWLTAGEAAPGRDYDPDALTWLWTVTSLADKTIIERNQAGVASQAYQPGPFSLMEPGTRAYVDRYVQELASVIGAAREV